MLHTMQLRKLLRLITAVFFLANLSESAYSQVIDGKQYNIVNNWYNWQGGRFITNLNVPKVQATNGRDTGAIYYKIADSSLYVWTGSQWRQVTGGGGGATDTASLSNRINAKLSISDTASMLSPYLRSNVAAATYQPIGSYATTSQVTAVQSNLDTTRTGIRTDLNGKQGALTLTTTGSSGAATLVGNTLNIPQYSGGGGSADSSWVSTETGIQPNMLGYLVNSTLGALPSGWADVSPDASVTFSSKMIISGGTTGTSSILGNIGTATAYSNRIDMDYYPYDKMRYAFTVVPQDKTSSSNGLALHFKSNSLFFSTGMRIVFDLTNTADSGKISMGVDFSTAHTTSANLAHNAGDTLDITVTRDTWVIKASMYNRRTRKFVDCKYYAYGSNFGTGGMAYLGLLGGTQHITSAKVESYDVKNGGAITLLGDSQSAGSGATSEEKTFPLQIFRGNKSKVANISNGSLTLSAAVTSHVPAAIALNNPVIVSLGFNDRRDLSTDTTTFKTRLDAVIDPLVAAGLQVWVTTLVPTVNTLSTFNTNFDLAIINYCAANGIPVIRIDSILKKSGDASNRIKENYLGNDAIHWSDSGQYIGAQKVIQRIGEVLPSLFSDTSSAVTMYNLPTGESNMNRVVVDNQGKVRQVPATTFDAVYNARNYNGAGTVAQSAEIHITNPVKSDSAIFVHNRNGLMIGFNGGNTLEAGSAGTNIEITNDGAGATGNFPQRFISTASSTNNVMIRSVTKGGYSPTFTGDYNIFLGFNAGVQTTSGSQNFEANLGSSVSGITTGNDIIKISPNVGPTTSSNQLLIGWASSGWGNAANRIHLGYGSYGGAAASETVIAPAENGAIVAYLTQKLMYSGSLTMKMASNGNGGNTSGYDWNFESSLGNGTGNSGTFNFKTTSPSAHGSYISRLSIQNQFITVGTARFQTKAGANVASANDLTLGNDGNVFTITGTTQINAITTTNWQAGSEITLVFAASVTVKHNTAGGGSTAVMKLAGAADFSATADDVLTLIYNGTSWVEKARSIN